MGKSIIFFNSTHHVIKAEKVLTSSGLQVKVIPVPPRMKADCGLALQFKTPLGPQIREVLKRANVSYADIRPPE